MIHLPDEELSNKTNEALDQMLNSSSTPTAVVACGDIFALRFIRESCSSPENSRFYKYKT